MVNAFAYGLVAALGAQLAIASPIADANNKPATYKPKPKPAPKPKEPVCKNRTSQLANVCSLQPPKKTTTIQPNTNSIHAVRRLDWTSWKHHQRHPHSLQISRICRHRLHHRHLHRHRSPARYQPSLGSQLRSHQRRDPTTRHTNPHNLLPR